MNYLTTIDLLDAGVPEEKHDDCMKWALGDDYGSLLITQTDEIWNARHSNIFELYGSDLISESVNRIGKAYLEHISK